MIDVINTWSVSDSESKGKKSTIFSSCGEENRQANVSIRWMGHVSLCLVAESEGFFIARRRGVTLSRGEGLRH